MDLSNLQQIISKTDFNEVYTFQRPYPQYFSVSYPVIKYMIQNPQSPKTWKKLIETCKYFYTKKSILPVAQVIVQDNEYDDIECYADDESFHPSVLVPKLWVYDIFEACGEPVNISLLLPKIFKFDINYLGFCNQHLTLNEYQKLTSSGSIKKLELYSSVIKNGDDTITTFDKLFDNLVNIEEFEMTFSTNLNMFKSDTVKKTVIHLTGCKKLRVFELDEVPESFDFASFKDFLIKNGTVHIEFTYSPQISDAYKEMVTSIVEEIDNYALLKVGYR